MSKRSTKRWLLAASTSAVLLAVAAGLLLHRQGTGGAAAVRARVLSVAPDAGCEMPEVVPTRALPGAEAPPVILWAAGTVRLFVDGAPAFSSPEEPITLPVGEHTLRAEAPGAEPLTTRFRVDSFSPAFFHAQLDSEVGITLVRLGTSCASCDPALDEVRLEPVRSTERTATLLADAARALRNDDWRTAAARLRGVAAGQRRLVLFHRLAAGVYLATAQSGRARAELESSEQKGAEVRSLLARLDALKRVEAKREEQIVLARWNKVTERFSRLVDRFEPVVAGPVTVSAKRMAELSKAFAEAVRQGDLVEEESQLLAAEEALATLAAQLRASRPLDCPFQADVVQTLMR